jgi:hypothetical protein
MKPPALDLPAHPSRGRDNIIVPFLIFSALLLAILIPDVIWRKPTMPAEMRQQWVMHHQAARNYLLAQKLIASRLPSPVGCWSPSFTCGDVGRGIWFAKGVVGTQPPAGPEILSAWTVLFIPGESQPLYLHVGTREEGNFNTALERAGLHAGKP